MLPVKSEIKSVEVSYVETKSFLIKIPSLKIPLHYLKVGGICISLGLLFVVLTSLDTPVVEERNISREVLTDTVVSAMGIVETLKECTSSNAKECIVSTKQSKDVSLAVRLRAIELLKKNWNPQNRVFKKRGGGFSKQDNTVVITKEDMLKYVPDFIVEEVLMKVPALASISTAQADIEGNWWTSNLAKKTNNNFGIKYVKKWDKNPEVWMAQYRQGHEVAHDDLPTDKFIKFKSKWACIRFHTKFLTLLHYKKHIGKDFNGWAVGLKTSGYATDKNYPNALKNRYKLLDLKTVDAVSYQLRKEFSQ